MRQFLLYATCCDSRHDFTRSFHSYGIFLWAKIVGKVIQRNKMMHLPSSSRSGFMYDTVLFASPTVFLLCGCSLESLFSVSDIQQTGEALCESVPLFSVNHTHSHVLFLIPVMVVRWKEIRGGGEFLAHACLHFTVLQWFLIFSLRSMSAFRVQVCCCRLLFGTLMCKEWIGVQCDLRGPGHWWWPLQQSVL